MGVRPRPHPRKWAAIYRELDQADLGGLPLAVRARHFDNAARLIVEYGAAFPIGDYPILLGALVMYYRREGLSA
jgi:hypothetical protein